MCPYLGVQKQLSLQCWGNLKMYVDELWSSNVTTKGTKFWILKSKDKMWCNNT